MADQHQQPHVGPPAAPTSAPAKPAASHADRMPDDKKKLQEERDQRAKEAAERDKKRGTPTPTQEEIDLVKLGHHVELANDGSGPDPSAERDTVKHIGGKPAGEYSTRSMQAKS